MKKPLILYNCDFETLTEGSEDYKRLGHTAVYLWGYRKLDPNEPKKIIGSTIEEWYESIFSDLTNKIIWFHNQKFDGNFIEKFLINKTKLKYINDISNSDNEKAMPLNSFKIFRDRSNLYSIEIYRLITRGGKRYTTRIIIHCSYLLLNASLKALGKDYNLDKYQHKEQSNVEWYDKGGFNMNPTFELEMRKYLKSDLDIQALALWDFLKHIELDRYFSSAGKSIPLKKMLTIGGITTKMFHNYLKEKKELPEDKYEWSEISKYKGKVSLEQHMFSRNWLQGGFTQFNPKLIESQKEKGYTIVSSKNKRAVSIDIVSAYPWATTQPMPYGLLSETPFPKSDLYINLEYYHLKVKSAKIKSKYYDDFVILKHWDKKNSRVDRYVRYLNNFECYYLKEEWEIINRVYDIELESQKIWYSKASTYVEEFILPIFNLKSLAKQIGKPALERGAKVRLVAFYGQLCKKVNYNTLIAVSKDTYNFLGTRKKGEYMLSIGKEKYILQKISGKRVGNYYYIEALKITKKQRFAPPVLMGATITAYTRIKLWNTILDLGYKFFNYASTDELFMSLNKEEIEKKITLEKYKLGSFALAKEYDRITIGGANRYLVSNNDGSNTKYGFTGINFSGQTNNEIINLLCHGGEIYNAGFKIKEDSHGILLTRVSKKITQGTI